MAGSPKKFSTGLSHVEESEVHKPAVIKKVPTKNKDGSYHKSPTSLFGPHAVTRYLRIPQTGNITSVRPMVFLPELLRSPGILFRLFQNGADAQALARIST
ncbi:hypothetical protein G6011_00278 [Alternaria panax]|uniref:Uncharacterized protein n=1 Tax=Alternaria panax TaxID=48097 RepID=A0AAD4NUV1_9PLEO|nr:hypothetical protein G6011_00278 [Alternaria panax]